MKVETNSAVSVGLSGLQDSFRALRHRDFRLYTAGQSVSLIGTWMQSVAQSWLVYRLTHSESMLGITLFATYIPVLLLGPLGGMAADRFSRKWIVFTTQLLALLQALTLAALTWSGRVTAYHVIALAAVVGVISAFDIPGRQTLFIQMVGRQDLISAISLNSAVFNLSRIIGPSLAGLVVAAFGEAVCFTINAASFLAMLACVASMRLPHVINPLGKGGSGSLAEGFRYAWRSRELRLLLVMSGLLNIGYAPLLALGPFFADDIFRKGSAGLGFLLGAMGIGAVIGVVHLARYKGIRQLPGIILSSSLLMGASLAVFGLSPWFSLSLFMMMCIGFSIMRQNAGGNSLIQTTVPDEFRGRLMALYTMFVTGLLPFGSLAAGFLADRFGPRPVVFSAGVLCLAGGIAFRFAMPAFQAWDHQQEEVCLV